MDQLWAPWRARYIQESAANANANANASDELGSEGRPRAARPEPCFFCRGLGSSELADRDNMLVWRRSHTVVFLNRFPYNNGHLLIAPNRHEGMITALKGEDLHQPLETIQHVVSVLTAMMQPQGFNIGLNMGKSAGAGVPGHLHWHVVPRWDGDTNFMPVLADTKVIIESLWEFYDRFAHCLREQKLTTES